MRASYLVLLAGTTLGGAAVAQNAGNTASPATTAVPQIHFDLAKPKPARPESLPAAATLGDLTYANEKPPAAAAKAAHAVAPKPAVKPAPKVAAKIVAKPAPKPVAARPAPKLAVAKPANGPWMSAWRRAYIAKHGHQPPVPAPALRH